MQSSIFEFINMISLYLFSVFLGLNIKFKKSTTPDPAPKQKIPTPTPSETKPKLNLVKSKQALSLEGYKASKCKDNDKLLDADIKKYLEYVSEYCKANNTNIVPGYQNVSKKLKNADGEKMAESRVRDIVAWLSQEGILNKENGRFVIVKNNMKGVG